jgi:hypothetical protein
MKEYSLRIELTVEGALVGWLDDHSAVVQVGYTKPLPIAVDTRGGNLYQAITRCILQIRARGDSVLYIDLPERVQNMDRCFISL